MRVKIYQPAANSMQSAPTPSRWVVEPIPDSASRIDPLMGWSGSKGATNQLRISFPTRDAAIEYAISKKVDYEVLENQGRFRKPNIRQMGYAENFANNRREPWTH